MADPKAGLEAADGGLWDCVVVGAGPAGLTAAIYLARYRRRFLVLHDSRSRARWIPKSRNHPGFPSGVHGTTLLSLLETQARKYGAVFEETQVEAVRVSEDGFSLAGGGREFRARTVLLAAGVSDLRPSIPGIEEAIRRGLVRICPICDGYEVAGKRVLVLTDGDLGAREALFLRTWTDQLTVAVTRPAAPLSLERRRELQAAGIDLQTVEVDAVRIGRKTVTIEGLDGSEQVFDHLYTAFGCRPRNELATGLGAVLNEEGYVLAGAEHQQTPVPGLYAAGDCVRGLNQISVAEAEGAIAATAIHNLLRQRDGQSPR